MYNDETYAQRARELIFKIGEYAQTTVKIYGTSLHEAIGGAAFYTISHSTNPEHAMMLPEMNFKMDNRDSFYDFLYHANIFSTKGRDSTTKECHELVKLLKTEIAETFQKRKFPRNFEEQPPVNVDEYNACIAIYHGPSILSAASTWGNNQFKGIIIAATHVMSYKP